jgi:HlyD family secretion protein
VIGADNAGLALRPGMTANVDIVTGRREQVLRVPTAALVPGRTPARAGAAACRHGGGPAGGRIGRSP